MNVLLLKKIKKLGDIGQEVSVKAGYARNFLFPKKFALPMTRENIETAAVNNIISIFIFLCRLFFIL